MNFYQDARPLQITREVVVIGDMYAEIQPSSIPEIDRQFINKILNICETCDLE